MIPICDHKDCFLPSEVECHLPLFAPECETPEETTEYYCFDHAIENGYCYICGVYIVPGNESHDMPDLCENCEDELKAEFGEMEEDTGYIEYR